MKSKVEIRVRLMAAVCALAAFLPSYAATFELEVLPGESWFGGGTAFGHDMPWTAATKKFSRDLRKNNYTNQTSPILLSDKGRWVWCDEKVSGLVFEIVIPHGRCPAGASCSWRVRPYGRSYG